MSTAPSDVPPEHALDALIAAATSDADLCRRLLAEPAAVLHEAGLTVREGVRVSAEMADPEDVRSVVARSTPDHLVLAIPTRKDGPLRDDELDAVSGGWNHIGDHTAVTGWLIRRGQQYP